MLSAFQRKDVVNIRNNYSTSLLYITLRCACAECCDRPQSYLFTEEQVFVEVSYWLDELKQEQQDVMWDDLYRTIRKDYRIQDTSIPEEELDYITSTIVCALASILTISIHRFYHGLAEKLFIQASHNVPESFEGALDKLIDGIENHDVELRQWLDDYMQSDEFISNDFLYYFSPVETIGKHIVFTKQATNEQRAEFISVIKKEANSSKTHGKTVRIKAILVKYRSDEVIELIGKDSDIFEELNTIYKANISHSAFYRKPKLIKK